MKVTVIFNQQRQTFNEVESLSFGDFVQAVAATFGLEPNDFDIMLGDNVILLDATHPISEFGVISGDLLYVRLKNRSSVLPALHNPIDMSQPNSESVVPDPTTSHAAQSVSTSDSAVAEDEKTCVSELADDEKLDEFLITEVSGFMKKAGFEEGEKTLSNYFVSLPFVHQSAPEISAEITINLYRDSPLDTESTSQSDKNTRVTSASLNSMTLVKKFGDRNFYEAIFLQRDCPNLIEQLTASLTLLKESVLGPENPFLRALSQHYVSRIFCHLQPTDILNIESTCRYARNRCRSSRLIDDTIWKNVLKTKYGEGEVQKVAAAKASSSQDLPRTYREAYLSRLKGEKALHRYQRQRNFFRHESDWNVAPPSTPYRNPFAPVAGPGPVSPYAPDAPLMNPRRLVHPDADPTNPAFGHMVVPSEPRRRPDIEIDPFHPFAPDGFNPPDPDMPQGPFGGGFPPRGRGQPPRNGGGGFFPGGGFIG